MLPKRCGAHGLVVLDLLSHEDDSVRVILFIYQESCETSFCYSAVTVFRSLFLVCCLAQDRAGWYEGWVSSYWGQVLAFSRRMTDKLLLSQFTQRHWMCSPHISGRGGIHIWILPHLYLLGKRFFFWWGLQGTTNLICFFSLNTTVFSFFWGDFEFSRLCCTSNFLMEEHILETKRVYGK